MFITSASATWLLKRWRKYDNTSELQVLTQLLSFAGNRNLVKKFLPWEIFSIDFVPRQIGFACKGDGFCILYEPPTNLFFFIARQLYSFCRDYCQGMRKAAGLQGRYLSHTTKTRAKKAGWYKLFPRYGTFSRITEKYDVTPLSTQLSPLILHLPSQNYLILRYKRHLYKAESRSACMH